MIYGFTGWFLANLVLGALIWLSVASLPSWRRLEPKAGAKAYVHAFSRGGPVLAVLAALAAGLAVAAAFATGDWRWSGGAAGVGGALLFTVLAMGPPGHSLRDAAAETAAGDTPDADIRRVLDHWGRLNLIRTALVAAGVFFFVWAAH